MRRDSSQESVLAITLLLALLLQWPLYHFIVLQTRPVATSHQEIREPGKIHGVFVPVRPVRKKRAPLPKGQIVNLPREIETKTPPKKARFLSRFNTSVKKETVARRPSRTKVPIHGKRVKRISRLQSPKSRSLRPTRLAKGRTKTSTVPRKAPRTSKGMLFSRNQMVKGLKHVLLPGKLELQKANLQERVGSLSDNDAVLDLKKGDETLLNSKRFVFWSFFERVKEQVEAQWEPQEALLEWDPKLKEAAKRDRLTVLKVVLDSRGRVLGLKVITSSGLGYLDQEAIRAFKAAQPFPNPPKGLLDRHGRIVFSFGFLVTFDRGVRFFWRRW